MTEKALVLIDGEHLPDVTLSGIEHVRSRFGYEVVAAVFLGGREKLAQGSLAEQLGLEVSRDSDVDAAVVASIRKHRPTVVVDLSDEPVLGYRRRFELASVILAEGVRYEGADFRFEPPTMLHLARTPSLSVVGTGKRVGKTALGAYVARVLSGQEGPTSRVFKPCIVTMGRGGPAEPELVRGEALKITPRFLLEQSRAGKHAASDYFEDALMARVPTIGCRRCGGGLAGATYFSMVPEGARLANTLESDFQIYEGSGASLPPIATDACLLTIGAFQSVEQVEAYLGPYRVRRADLVVLTMCEEPIAGAEKVNELAEAVAHVNPQAKLARIIFRPKPLADVTGRNVILATTAPHISSQLLAQYLEETFDCHVIGMTHNLSDRAHLEAEMTKLIRKSKADTVLVEVKAAGIDVATRIAVESGLDVVYTDNIPLAVDGESTAKKVADLAALAVERFNNRDTIEAS